MEIVENYNDTEFPGVACRPLKVNDDSIVKKILIFKDFEYQLIKENVNSLKLIQIGMTFCNEKGQVPPFGPATWQFNFNFDLNQDKYHLDGIQLLKNSGINFEQLKIKGIEPIKFAELIIVSGVLLNEDVKWICFHGGFDFSYFLRLLINTELPELEDQFYSLLELFFPNFYDIKFVIKDFEMIKHDGLNKLAQDLDLERIGQMHQAGSDSLLTLSCYFKLKEMYFSKRSESMNIEEPIGPNIETFHNILYGIGKGFVENKDYLWNYKNKYPNNSYWNDFNNDMSMFYSYGNYVNNIGVMMYQPNYNQNTTYYNTGNSNYNNVNYNYNLPQNFGNNNGNFTNQTLPSELNPNGKNNKNKKFIK